MMLRTFLILLLASLAAPLAAQTCPPGNPRVAPDSRYVVSEPDPSGHPNERVVRDLRTGLEWKQCSEGQTGTACTGLASSLNWSAALGAAQTATWAGHTDWRLPNINELSSLVESGCHNPSINTTVFPGTPNTSYRSSTTYVPNASRAWYTRFNDGLSSFRTKSSFLQVRLVRGGQWLDPLHTLNYSAGPNGSLSGDTSQTVVHGSDGTAVTAVPDAGYHFVNWSDGATDNPRTDSNVQGNIAVTANFAINQYSLSYSAGANGSLTGPANQTVNHGANGAAVTAVPDTGYHFVNWSDGATDNPRTDTNVQADINVTANFAINQYSLSYTAGPNGSLTGPTSQTVNHGADGTAVTAVPDAGYHFVNWSDGATDNPRTDTNVQGNIAVTANFAINQYSLNYTAGANGSLTGSTSQTVNHGADGTAVTAVPDAGYHFVNWSDGATDNPRTDTNVQGNIAVTANFAIHQYSLSYTAGANGSLTGPTSQTVSHGADGTAVTAVPDAGYHFVNWSDGATDNPRTDTNVQGNIAVTANFAINQYSLNYTAGANGSLTGPTSQTVNHGANGAAVTAVPDTGYHFVNWSDGATDNPRTDTNVQGNIAVTANFAINQYSLNYSAGANGSLTGPTSQTVNHGADGAAVTAVPDAGYHFVNWSDGATDNPRTDTNVQGNIAVTANFAPDDIPISLVIPSGHGTASGPATVPYGSGASFTLTPDAGYEIANVSGCSGTLSGNIYTIPAITAACTITVNFNLLGGVAPRMVPAVGWKMLLMMMALVLSGAVITLRRNS